MLSRNVQRPADRAAVIKSTKSYIESLTHVASVRRAAGYLRGKKNLARRICALIEETPNSSYAKPFVVWVTLSWAGGRGRAPRRRRRHVLPSAAGALSLFRRHAPLARHQPAEFPRLMALPADGLTDLQWAAGFLNLQRLALGGKVEGPIFGMSARDPRRFDVARIEPMLAEIHERLAGVVIKQLSYGEMIRRYYHDGALFSSTRRFGIARRTTASACSNAPMSSAWPINSPPSAKASTRRSATRRARARCSADLRSRNGEAVVDRDGIK